MFVETQGTVELSLPGCGACIGCDVMFVLSGCVTDCRRAKLCNEVFRSQFTE